MTQTAQNAAITALVCTRNRGESLIPTVRSILANTYPEFELVVIDQSTNDETQQALAPFLSDTRLRCVRSDTHGLGRAHNLGLREAKYDIVAITDDDCEVPADWAAKMASVFVENPNVAMAFCNVLAAPGEWEGGYIPTFERKGDLLVTTLRERCKSNPIGAGMGVRKSLIQELGGFDEMLGPGAPIQSHEEDDMALRVLLGGYQVFETDRTCVYHYGFRTVEQSKVLAFRNYHGTGGGLAKFLKCGKWGILPIVSHIWWATILKPLFSSLIRLQKPRVVSRITGFFAGFMQGWRMPVDTKTLLFRSN